MSLLLNIVPLPFAIRTAAHIITSLQEVTYAELKENKAFTTVLIFLCLGLFLQFFHYFDGISFSSL